MDVHLLSNEALNNILGNTRMILKYESISGKENNEQYLKLRKERRRSTQESNIFENVTQQRIRSTFENHQGVQISTDTGFVLELIDNNLYKVISIPKTEESKGLETNVFLVAINFLTEQDNTESTILLHECIREEVLDILEFPDRIVSYDFLRNQEDE